VKRLLQALDDAIEAAAGWIYGPAADDGEPPAPLWLKLLFLALVAGLVALGCLARP
jgi:hypothetical protein